MLVIIKLAYTIEDDNLYAIIEIKSTSKAIEDQNLSRLLIKIRKLKRYSILEHLKKGMSKVLLVSFKGKHQNDATAEFINGNFGFKCFTRSSTLFLSTTSWASRKEKFRSHKSSSRRTSNQGTKVNHLKANDALCNFLFLKMENKINDMLSNKTEVSANYYHVSG